MENQAMQALEAFIVLLGKEANAIRQLLSQEEEKFDVLKQVNMKGLMQINSREEETLSVLDWVEGQRKEALIRLSAHFGFDRTSTLTTVVEAIPADHYSRQKEKLAELRAEIKQLTERLQVAMTENSDIIRSNLEIINLTLNFASRNAQKETYDYRNKKESRENLFLFNQIA